MYGLLSAALRTEESSRWIPVYAKNTFYEALWNSRSAQLRARQLVNENSGDRRSYGVNIPRRPFDWMHSTNRNISIFVCTCTSCEQNLKTFPVFHGFLIAFACETSLRSSPVPIWKSYLFIIVTDWIPYTRFKPKYHTCRWGPDLPTWRNTFSNLSRRIYKCLDVGGKAFGHLF